MQIPKLSLSQWIKVITAVVPIVGGLVRVAGVGVVSLVRAALDVAGQVESLFPPAIGPDGQPIRTGSRKREEFISILSAGFSTASEKADEVAEVFGRLADVLAPLLTEMGIFRKA